MTTEYGNILERGSRLKKLLAISATALIASVSVAAPAWAGASGEKRIEANYSIDYVLLEHYPQAGQQVRVDVFRNATAEADSGVRIGTFTGQTVGDAKAGNMLEINHVGGDDCWQGASTPDILPGDKIQATILTGAEAGNVDYTFMRNLDFADANERVSGFATGNEAGEGFNLNGPIALGDAEGGAFVEAIRVGGQDANGVALDKQVSEIAQLGPNGEFDVALPGTGGEVFVQYVNPNAVGNGDESTVAEPRGAEGEAIADCPPLARTAMTDVSRETINIANAGQDLTVSGVAQDGVTGVNVALGGQTYNATPANGTWTATVPAADLANLPQGKSNIVATFQGETAPAQPQTRSIQKDTVAPADATATPKPGLYNAAQSVSLNGPADAAQIRYTVDGSEPTATSGNVYNGQIQVTSDQTIKALVVDAAGNSSGVASFAYTIDTVAPGLPTASLESGSYDAAQQMGFASDAADLKEIRYTTNGDTPTANSGQLYVDGQPVNVASTTTFKAVAVDKAGNASQVLERTITIRAATRTTLAVATTDLKLGATRAVRGAVAPNHAGGAVKVTIDRPGTLSTISRSVALDDFSRYGLAYKPSAAGVYRVTASFAGDADSLGSASETKSFRVVR